jgi:hypothetical protein
MVDWAMDNGATPFSLSEQVWWIDLGISGFFGGKFFVVLFFQPKKIWDFSLV